MTITGICRAAAASAFVSLSMFVAPASATTLWEADVAGGEFSADYRSPTAVGADITAISGIGGNSSDDYFVFTGLDAGSLTLSFAAPEGIGYSYSAGGVILWDTSPFDYEWDGTQVSPSVQIDYYKRDQTVTLDLPKDFLGTLYLALNFTHGEGLTYEIGDFRVDAGLSNDGAADRGVVSGGTSASVGAAVPLPAPLLLLGSSLLGLGALGARARRRAA